MVEPDTGTMSGAERVLIVEDEPLLRFVAAEAFRDAGFVVAEAATADEAWTYLQAGGPTDVLFSDIRMPGSMDGLALAERVRVRFPHLKIVLASADSVPGDASSWIDAYFAKPYDLARVAARIARMLGRDP